MFTREELERFKLKYILYTQYSRMMLKPSEVKPNERIVDDNVNKKGTR